MKRIQLIETGVLLGHQSINNTYVLNKAEAYDIFGGILSKIDGTYSIPKECIFVITSIYELHEC